MNAKDFEKMAKDVTKNFSGKTIHHASFSEHYVSYSLILHFTDGTTAEITPEFDEGFKFSDPNVKVIIGSTNNLLCQGGSGGNAGGEIVIEEEEKKK